MQPIVSSDRSRKFRTGEQSWFRKTKGIVPITGDGSWVWEVERKVKRHRDHFYRETWSETDGFLGECLCPVPLETVVRSVCCLFSLFKVSPSILPLSKIPCMLIQNMTLQFAIASLGISWIIYFKISSHMVQYKRSLSMLCLNIVIGKSERHMSSHVPNYKGKRSTLTRKCWDRFW
ncbi:hypothetical protein M5689_012107 [Euphorbia peplus]|nr:hypothetical protein M5689_012107 [Euphorbia peplus]